MGEASEGREARLVREALSRALTSVEGSVGYDDLSADHLMSMVLQELGPYENRARRLRSLVGQAVEEHFARAGSGRAMVDDGKVRLGNVDLRSLVRGTLRRHDLRQPFTVRQCREAVAYSLGVSSDLASLTGLEFSGLVMQEWVTLWEGAWRDFVYHAKDTDETCCRARVRTRRTGGLPVLEQCLESVVAGTMRCSHHAGDLHWGEWDPLGGLTGIRLSTNVHWVIAEAKRRAGDARRPLSEGSDGFNLPRQRRCGAGGNAGSRSVHVASGTRVPQPTPAPKFCVLTSPESCVLFLQTRRLFRLFPAFFVPTLTRQ